MKVYGFEEEQALEQVYISAAVEGLMVLEYIVHELVVKQMAEREITATVDDSGDRKALLSASCHKRYTCSGRTQ